MQRLLFATLACAGCAHPPPPATLSADLSTLDFYVGRWTCTGDEYDVQGAVTKHYTNLEVRVAPAYDHWMTVDVFENGAHATSELKGHDATGFHHVWTANDGSYGSLSSPGWAGNRLVFDEDRPAAAEKTRMTFTKLDATHYTHRAETDTGRGYQLGFEKSCRKV